MNLLIAHTKYQRVGGEDVVAEAEVALLRSNRHHVTEMILSNDRFSTEVSPSQLIRDAASTIWSRDTAQRIRSLCRESSANVVHVHNFFPAASPSLHSEARSSSSAVVQTLHNYRLLCPNALFFRDGHVCEDCLGKFVPWPGIAHACYRDSYSQTAVTAAMLTVHRARHTWHREVDRFIALTEFSRQKFIEGGLPADKIVVKPNFLANDPGVGKGGSGFLFIGRLDPAKGISTLLDAWHELPDISLLVGGTGPLADTVNRASQKSALLQYQGQLGRSSVLAEMKRSRALIFPSLWYEAFPMTIVEAFACGLPVIASNLGSMAEIITDHHTGLLFEPGNAQDLAAKVRWANENPEKMREYGLNARREYEQKYTAERNYEMLMDIYQQAIEHRRATT